MTSTARNALKFRTVLPVCLHKPDNRFLTPEGPCVLNQAALTTVSHKRVSEIIRKI